MIVDTHGMPTVVISGRSSTDSSRRAARQRSLESRLTARMDLSGSPEFTLRWKYSDTMFGGPICRLPRRVEPGTCPLPDGVPKRVGKLRAYGNAVVPQVAAGFITDCLERERS